MKIIGKIIFILGIFITISTCDNDDSTVIETLDGQKLTINKFNEAYNTAIESMSRLQNIEKKNLLEIISKNINDVDEPFKQLNLQFQKNKFYENYRTMLIVNMKAEKSGFKSRKEIKDILKQVEMQTVFQLYIQEQVEKKIKITEQDAEKECENLRQKDPRIKSLPLDRCIIIGRASLKQMQTESTIPKVLEMTKEEIAIKHNDKFDLDQYFSNEAPKQSTSTSSQTGTSSSPDK